MSKSRDCQLSLDNPRRQRAPDLEVGVSTADPQTLLQLVQIVSAVNDDAQS